MKKNTPFVGICSIIFLSFALITYFLLNVEGNDTLLLVPLFHLTVGTVFGAWFLFCGGLKGIQAPSVKHVAKFGTTVSIYCTLFVAIIVLVNYLASRHQFFYYDSTEEKVYTLATQTEEILSHLTQPIVLRGFYLGGMAEPKEDELIKRMINKFPEKLRWQVIDPERNPELAEKYGITEAGSVHITFESGEPKREVRITRDVSEEAIINAISRLTRTGKKIVYYLEGHGEPNLSEAGPSGYQFLKQAIEGENLILKPLFIKTDHLMPKDAALILIASGKKDWLPHETKAIEQYLSEKGSVLFLAEPRTTEDIQRTVKQFGVEVGNDVIVDPEVRLFSGPSLGVQPVITQYNYHPITKGFSEGIIMSIASSVRRSSTPPPGVGVFELALTGSASWAEKSVDLIFSDEPRAALDLTDIKGPVSIAVAVDRNEPGKNENPSGLKKGRLVVIGDTDFVSNANIRQLFNQDFFLNAMNWALGDDQGITIRARALRQSTKAITTAQFQNIFLITAVLLPELILVCGLWVWWSRKYL